MLFLSSKFIFMLLSCIFSSHFKIHAYFNKLRALSRTLTFIVLQGSSTNYFYLIQFEDCSHSVRFIVRKQYIFNKSARHSELTFTALRP